MDFIDRIKAFAATVPQKLDGIKTEAASKQFLITPFIQQILGYDTTNPNEVMPEYDANVGAATNYKIDYAIFQNAKPIILIECKCYGMDTSTKKCFSQLFHYYAATDARIGILTDGVIYQFFADLDKNNKMDKTPFLVLDLLNLNESVIEELSHLTKSKFDIDTAIESASELKYVGGIKSILREQLKLPNEDFAKYFFKELCPENIYTGKLKKDFLGYTLRGINEFITEEMKKMVDDFVNPPHSKTKAETDNDSEAKDPQIEFTENEREAYYILRAILSSVVHPARVTYRDRKSYCNILLDNNGRRKIVRLHFNNSEDKKLTIFSIDANGKKGSDTFPISDLNDIYEYADKFKEIVMSYEQPKSVRA